MSICLYSNFPKINPIPRGLTGCSVQRVLIRTVLSVCGLTYHTDPQNQGAVLIPRASLTLEQVRAFLGLLLSLPIDDPVPEDVQLTLRAISQPPTRELIEIFTIERAIYKEV